MLYCSNLRSNYKTNIKKIWQVIKEASRKGQVNRQVFLKKIVIYK